MDDRVREAFERDYACGDEIIDALSLCRNPDGTYQQALARMCYKWFCKGRASTEAAEARYKPLVEAAQAVVDRWHSTDWKAPPTADFMNRLRDALADAARVMKGE